MGALFQTRGLCLDATTSSLAHPQTMHTLTYSITAGYRSQETEVLKLETHCQRKYTGTTQPPRPKQQQPSNPGRYSAHLFHEAPWELQLQLLTLSALLIDVNGLHYTEKKPFLFLQYGNSEFCGFFFLKHETASLCNAAIGRTVTPRIHTLHAGTPP